MPDVGDDATTRAYLRDARQALATGRTGRAQEAMERAETRLLDRSVEPSRVGIPADNSLVEMISRARQALGAGDRVRVCKSSMSRWPACPTARHSHPIRPYPRNTPNAFRRRRLPGRPGSRVIGTGMVQPMTGPLADMSSST